MADYKKMYQILFSAIVRAIRELETSTLGAEEEYVSKEEKVLELTSQKSESIQND